ncbi:hypothetical protein psyc5s11_31640 [Clostridium gelidum]|uniref:Oligosaccharide repeat unit polymerase n=1 Tax=Clostridium gelidum TaxID=704125 RepID=A0ABN6IYR0_9CLOT|nr:O-antigen polymerase [Clostridium gelidum]BCZ47097.1 hypothetical protein psyc5s11_31640 [Clostridium gelidum]
MDYNSFYEILNQNIIMYMYIMIPIALIYFIAVKRQLYNVYDPLFLFILYSIGATTTNIFLYKLNYIKTDLIVQYVLTEIAFVVGLNIFKKINLEKIQAIIIYKKEDFELQKVVFIITSIIYIIAQLYVYIKIGIPMFYDQTEKSLIDMQLEAGKFTIILTGCLPILIYCGISNIMNSKKSKIQYKIYNISILIFVVISLVLSGWKSNFIIIVFIGFYYSIYMYRFLEDPKLVIRKIHKMSIKILGLAFISAILITAYRYTNCNYNEALDYIFHRFAISGDIFIYSYVNDSILNQVDSGNFITNLFGNLVFFKHWINAYSTDAVKANLGLQVFKIFKNVNYVSGPNPRHNFFGMIYFGTVGSIFYSFFIGVIIGFVRNKLYYKLPANIFGGIIYSSIAYYIIYAHIDLLSLCLGPIDAFLIIFITIYILSHIILKTSKQ